MVNVVGKEEPNEEEYSPDGRYTPRILFLGSRHKYYLNFYDRAEDIIRAMKESLVAVKGMRAL
uniref:Uncharacterized protein n=1 Tax=Parascaris equorum TaxID=6256 RepID=A0A914RD78_PAREQ